MHMLEDEIVPITPEREKFFGCTGRMLLPCPATVAALVNEVPRGKVTTLDLFRAELARRHRVEAVCPFQTKQALRAIASQPKAAPLWRLVRKNGELLKYLPGGVASQAALLGNEKMATEPTASGRKVKNLGEYLVRFEPNA